MREGGEDEDDDGSDALLFKPQDKIKVGFLFFKNMFFDEYETRTQVRVLLNLKKTDTAIINVSTMKGGKA